MKTDATTDTTPTPPVTDYLARIPLTVDRTELVVRLFADPTLVESVGDAAHQVNAAIAALVEMAIEDARGTWAIEAEAAGCRGLCCVCGERGDEGDRLYLIDYSGAARAHRRCMDTQRLVADGGGAATLPPVSGASWASRVAAALAEELSTDRAASIVAQAIAGQALRGSVEHLEYAAALMKETAS
jgi:hypothetical protein